MSIIADDGMVEPGVNLRWTEVTAGAHGIPPENWRCYLPAYPQRGGGHPQIDTLTQVAPAGLDPATEEVGAVFH